MQHFFVNASQIEETQIIIEGSDVNHIKNVLRMRPGEEVSVSDGISDTEYRCAVDSFEDDKVILKLLFKKEANVELPVEVVLYQGLPKSDKMEFIIQKCVELGVRRIVPVAMKRSVMKLDGKHASSKVERWQKIAEAAAKQSQRGVIPEVAQVMTYKEALKDAANLNVKLLPYELCEDDVTTKAMFGQLKSGDRIGILIGPEGGFDEGEVASAKEEGFVPVTLGKRILRTETAGMATLCFIMYETEIM